MLALAMCWTDRPPDSSSLDMPAPNLTLSPRVACPGAVGEGGLSGEANDLRDLAAFMVFPC